MAGCASKIRFALSTYLEARRAISRQFRPEEIARTQNARLRRLIRHSFENTKYYRELFEQAGIEPEQIETAQDIIRIPFLTRDELRRRFWDFLPNELPACRVSRTSGSTGVPVCVLSDANSRLCNSAAVIRYRSALGIGFFTGAVLTPLKTPDEPCIKRAHRTFLQGLHRTYYVNPYVDSATNIEYAAELFSRLKDPALVGITPAVRALACRIRDGVFPCLRPSVILTSGEILEPHIRMMLEATFNSKVADIYACNEAGDIAWQCKYGGGYHINTDNTLVEIVRDDKPTADEDVGEVVITNLNRYSMPIIRYKNGDLARLTRRPCPCGCKLPMIAEIVGRCGEDVTLADGKIMPWNLLKGPMNHPHIRQFQLVQNADGTVMVKYCAEKNANLEALENLLLYRYKQLLGSSVKIRLERVEQIAPAASGKSKLVISHFTPTGDSQCP